MEEVLKQFQNDSFRWKILKSHFNKHGHSRHQFLGYENFMLSLLPAIVKENSTQTWRCRERCQIHTLTFDDVQIFQPTIREHTGVVHSVTPYEARMRQLNYSNPVMVNLTHTVRCYATETLQGSPVSTQEHVLLSVPLCRIPTMVGSRLCSLYSATTQNECPLDSGGYFICNGLEKVLVAQLKLRRNYPFVFSANGKYRYICEIRSVSHTKMRSTSTLQIKATYALGKSGYPDITVVLPFLHRGTQPLEIPLYHMFVLLGVSYENVRAVVKPGEGFHQLSPAALKILEAQASVPEKSREELLRVLGSSGTRESTVESQNRYVKHILTSETLPHVGISTEPKIVRLKAYMMGQYVAKLLQVITGEREPESRDSYAVKRLDGQGDLLAILFRQLFRNFLKGVHLQVQRALDNKKTICMQDYITAVKITNQLAYHFR